MMAKAKAKSTPKAKAPARSKASPKAGARSAKGEPAKSDAAPVRRDVEIVEAPAHAIDADFLEADAVDAPIDPEIAAEIEASFDPSFDPGREESTLEAMAGDPDEASEARARAIVPEIVRKPRAAAEGEGSGKALTTIDPVATYLAEIRRYPLLTREEERALAVRYREAGDAAAAERLVTSNLRFVVKIAAEYSKFGAKLIDLIQEGNVGLMHAVKEFNPYKNVRLITYAVWWIRGYIQEYLMRQYSLVRIGTTQNQRKLFYRLQRERAQLDSMGQEPNFALLSSRLGVPQDEVETMAKRLSGRDVSLNQPLDDESKSTLLDMEPSEEPGVDEAIGRAEELEVLRQNLEAIRGDLNEKETFLLEHRVLADEPMTLQEIGDKYGVTREAVRQLEARLIGKIRSAVIGSLAGEAGEGADEETARKR